ncbi:MAG: glucose 1-dehydrogenase [Parachlamydiales bacterium]
MKAVALDMDDHKIHIVDVEEPQIERPDQVKVKVLEVGVCGTDREEASGGRADAPPGEKQLIIGHEMLSEVVEVGSKVTRFKPGDLAAITVRRGCGKCSSCAAKAFDMCYTGEYTERGIKERNGYQTGFVIEEEQYIVKVPSHLRSVGVLTEPTSVVEKAIDEMALMQTVRLPGEKDPKKWFQGKKVLIAGLGPIGLLGAMVLKLRGANVYGLDVVPPDSSRPRLFEKLGGHYQYGKEVHISDLVTDCGQVDAIFEATGIPNLDFDLLSVLGVNGIYVLTGVPGTSREISVKGAEILKTLVFKNQVLFGSVNANQRHWEMAVEDLAAAKERWGEVIDGIVTHRVPYDQAEKILMEHPADEIKAVIKWN